MKRHVMAAGFFALIALTGACSSGDVTVRGGASIATPAVSGAGSPSRSQTGGTGPASSGGVAHPGQKIFFERILAEEGLPQFVIAVSYLPQGSHDSAAFGVPLRVPQKFGESAIFVPGADVVTYLRSTGIGSDSLVVTRLSSSRSRPLFAFPRPVASFALNASRDLLAWAGVDGTLSTVAFGDVSAAVRGVDLSGYRAKSVAWNAVGTRLLMRTETDAWVFRLDPSTLSLKQEAVFRGVSGSVFSPKGDRLAIVGRDDRVLRVVGLDAATAPGHVPGDAWLTLESSQIHDLSWNDKRGMAYWVRLPDGTAEIRRIIEEKSTEKSPSEKILARLGIPNQVGEGVVCPAWSSDGQMIYYSDFIDGEYVIERLSDGKGSPVPALFAQPPMADEGYVCPASE
jgi:hypothetical protein